MAFSGETRRWRRKAVPANRTRRGKTHVGLAGQGLRRVELLEDRRMLTVLVETLHSFDSPPQSGALQPGANLTLVGSTVFGMTAVGGSDNDGTLFSMNADGSNYQVLHTFTGTDGTDPVGGLTLVGSTLYGTTQYGGADNDGTVFSINPNGSDFQILHTFSGSGRDGVAPQAGLTLVGSTLFGTTGQGGYGAGEIFSINTDGSDYQTVYAFDSEASGFDPAGGLTLVGSTLFGTTEYGGSGNSGTLFSVNTNGSGFQVLHSFQDTGSDAQYPATDLTLVGSTLFGTTEYGGSGYDGTVFSINTDGSGYQILQSFTTDSGGQQPVTGLTLVGSTLYGTTSFGGAGRGGTVFSMNPDGSGFQVVYSFAGTDTGGPQPNSALALAGSTLFGTTLSGGSAGFGSVFGISARRPVSRRS